MKTKNLIAYEQSRKSSETKGTAYPFYKKFQNSSIPVPEMTPTER